jgi:hypothetical protein
MAAKLTLDEALRQRELSQQERIGFKMGWNAAIGSMESDLQTAGHTLAGVAPTTTQGTKPCAGCKHALENEEPNRSSFSNCHLCKRTHKDYFECTASPVA